jgi:hypothetical protein
MPRVSLWFFAVAVCYAIIGMLWGLHMGASQDHSLLPAHAHWNLLGWVGMAIYGTFYALAHEQASTKLAWTVFVLANAGVLIMAPSLALLLLAGDDPNSPYFMGVGIGAIVTILAMITFAVSVWMVLLKKSK